MDKQVFLLDMDGVCTNFIRGASKVHGINWIDNPPDNFWNLGLTQTEFWRPITAIGESFWRELEEYPWFIDLHRMLLDKGDVVFVSSPSKDPYSLAGKIYWLQKRFGNDFRDFFLGSRKELMAGNGILIDDHDPNVDKFNRAGGQAIVFPQPWNCLRNVAKRLKDDERVDWLKGILEEALNE